MNVVLPEPGLPTPTKCSRIASHGTWNSDSLRPVNRPNAERAGAAAETVAVRPITGFGWIVPAHNGNAAADIRAAAVSSRCRRAHWARSVRAGERNPRVSR
ncbi:hypothetical protein [Nocardia testacea]|uniref:hypothetical protein n=1 Tax=Nocardia testacea TaxID=248551 RepID=UPI003A8AF381